MIVCTERIFVHVRSERMEIGRHPSARPEVQHKTRYCMVGDAVAIGGRRAKILATSLEHSRLDAPVINVTGKDVPMPYAANLEKAALIDVPPIELAELRESFAELRAEADALPSQAESCASDTGV